MHCLEPARTEFRAEEPGQRAAPNVTREESAEKRLSMRRQVFHRAIAAATVAGPQEGAAVLGDAAPWISRTQPMAGRKAEQIARCGVFETAEPPL